jgi:hypothetical protein
VRRAAALTREALQCDLQEQEFLHLREAEIERLEADAAACPSINVWREATVRDGASGAVMAGQYQVSVPDPLDLRAGAAAEVRVNR